MARACSAANALVYDRFTTWKDQSLASTLYKLWAGTAVYAGGKCVADNVWEDTVRDAHSGCAAALRVLVKQGIVSVEA